MSVEANLWISHRDLANLAREVMRHGQSFRFRAQGISMRPFIRSGDLLTVQPLGGGESPRLGDVILYQAEGDRLIAHRVVGGSGASLVARGRISGYRADETTLRVRGDRLWAPLERVRPAQLLGQVVAIERNARLYRLTGAGQRVTALAWIGLRALVRAVRSRLGKVKRRAARAVGGFFIASP